VGLLPPNPCYKLGGLIIKNLNKMKIETRIKTGKLKGWTIRKSKHGWYDLYSSNGVSQTQGKHTIDEIKEIVKSKQLS
jgi:hypothetical protein